MACGSGSLDAAIAGFVLAVVVVVATDAVAGGQSFAV
jgi:hypothetical protein